MAKLTDLITRINSSELTPANVKFAIEKFANEEKLSSKTNINDICKTLIADDTGMGLIQHLVLNNNINLLQIVLGLLDKSKNSETLILLKPALFEAIKLSNTQAYEILVQHLGQDNLKLIDSEVKQSVLRNSKYRFIMEIFKNNIDLNSKETLLEIAQNNNDLAFLLKQFPAELIKTARDKVGNNILHLALHNKNQNILRYMINHDGAPLLYQSNAADLTPIDIVYTDIEATAKSNNGNYNFTLLMLLDQVGADLENTQHKKIYEEYKKIPDYHQQFMLAKQVSSKKIVKAISFNGGGAKGAAFITALREAMHHNIIQTENIMEYGGTSAGAITAGICCLGLTIDECNDALNNFDFKKLMDEPTSNAIRTVKDSHAKKWIESYLEGDYFYLLYHMISTLMTEQMVTMFGSETPVLTAIRELVTEKTGIFKPTYLRNTLVELIKKRIDNKLKSITADNTKELEELKKLSAIDPLHITFEDLKMHPTIFKKLTVYITNLTTGKTEKCSAETTPNMSIVDAITYSASFPIFFEAAQKFEIQNVDGQRKRVPVLIDGKPVYCCDGGVLKNDPVDAFDNDHFNENTLTFLLVSSNAKMEYEKEIKEKYQEVKSSPDVLKQIYQLMRNVERNRLHDDDIRNLSRIIYINTQNVGTLAFNDKDKNAPILEAAAQDAIIDYLNRQTASSYSVLRPGIISLLMSYGVAHYATSGSGQIVKINPGRQLSPQQILRIYAAAIDSEVNMLRSIVNPNQRDLQGNKAMGMATLLNYTETVNRLRIAGDISTEEKYTITDEIPSYFNRDEAFLKTVLPDDKLQQLDLLYTEVERLKADNQQLNTDSLANQQAADIALQTKLTEIENLKTEKTNLNKEIQTINSQKEDRETELKSAKNDLVESKNQIQSLTSQLDKANEIIQAYKLKAILDQYDADKGWGKKYVPGVESATETIKKLQSLFTKKIEEITSRNIQDILNNHEPNSPKMPASSQSSGNGFFNNTGTKNRNSDKLSATERAIQAIKDLGLGKAVNTASGIGSNNNTQAASSLRQ